jgi:hypothetical protein
VVKWRDVFSRLLVWGEVFGGVNRRFKAPTIFLGNFSVFLLYTLSLMAPKQNDLKLPKKLIEQLGGESKLLSFK